MMEKNKNCPQTRKPNVLCVGFAKCGTTTLYEIMKQHKDVYLSAIKEPVYYQIPELRRKGFNWYLKRYYDKNINKKIIMEINNSLTAMRLSDIDQVYKDFDAKTKIIFLLREPVDKAFSYFKFGIKVGSMWCLEYYDQNCTNSSNFEKFIRNNKCDLNKDGMSYPIGKAADIILDGLYYDRIKKYISLFGRENVLCVVFDDLIKYPRETCLKIYDFIGIKEDKSVNYSIKANESNRKFYGKWVVYLHEYVIEKFIINFLIKYLPFGNYKLCSAIRDIRAWFIKILSFPSKDQSTVNDNTKRYLSKLYEEDLRKLDILIGESLLDRWY